MNSVNSIKSVEPVYSAMLPPYLIAFFFSKKYPQSHYQRPYKPNLTYRFDGLSEWKTKSRPLEIISC